MLTVLGGHCSIYRARRGLKKRGGGAAGVATALQALPLPPGVQSGWAQRGGAAACGPRTERGLAGGHHAAGAQLRAGSPQPPPPASPTQASPQPRTGSLDCPARQGLEPCVEVVLRSCLGTWGTGNMSSSGIWVWIPTESLPHEPPQAAGWFCVEEAPAVPRHLRPPTPGPQP